MAKTPAKTKVVLIQVGNAIKRVRIDGKEIEVQRAGPIAVNNTMGVTLTLADVDVTVEPADEKDRA